MVKIADWKTNPLDHPPPFYAIRNNHFPNQYYCDNNKKNPDVHWVLQVLQDLYHSATIKRVRHRSCISFLSDCLFPAFLPFLNSVFRIKLHLPSRSAGSSLPSRKVQGSSHSKDFSQLVFCQCLEFVSQTLFGFRNLFFEFLSLLWIFCSASGAATREHLLN